MTQYEKSVIRAGMANLSCMNEGCDLSGNRGDNLLLEAQLEEEIERDRRNATRDAERRARSYLRDHYERMEREERERLRNWKPGL